MNLRLTILILLITTIGLGQNDTISDTNVTQSKLRFGVAIGPSLMTFSSIENKNPDWSSFYPYQYMYEDMGEYRGSRSLVRRGWDMEFYGQATISEHWKMNFSFSAFLYKTQLQTKFDSLGTYTFRPLAATAGITISPEYFFKDHSSIKAGWYVHGNLSSDLHPLSNYYEGPRKIPLDCGFQIAIARTKDIGAKFIGGVELRYRQGITNTLSVEDQNPISHAIEKLTYHNIAILFHLNN